MVAKEAEAMVIYVEEIRMEQFTVAEGAASNEAKINERLLRANNVYYTISKGN